MIGRGHQEEIGLMGTCCLSCWLLCPGVMLRGLHTSRFAGKKREGEENELVQDHFLLNGRVRIQAQTSLITWFTLFQIQ